MELVTMTDREYHSLPHLSASKIKLLLESPREFKEKTWGDRPSSAMTVGTMVHMELLEPHKRHDDYVHVVDVKTEKTKRFESAFNDPSNVDKLVIKKPDYDEAMEICRAAQDRPEVLRILADGVTERAIIGEIPGIGPVKCKIDLLKLDTGDIIDLKTAAVRGSIRPDKCILDYNYHIQQAFYRMMLKEIGLGDVNFTFLFLFKNAPIYDRLICSLDADFQAYADKELQKLLDIFKRCQDTDTWGGRFSEEEIQIKLPKWLN